MGAIVDLFDAVITTEDEGQARILRSVAMEEMESRLGACGGGDMDFYERLFNALMERHQQRRSETAAARGETDHDRPL